MKARDPVNSPWRMAARSYFSEFAELVETSSRPGEFLVSLLAKFPADLAVDKAALYLSSLEGFVSSMIMQDITFASRRGVTKGICELRSKLTEMASPPAAYRTPSDTARRDSATDGFAQSFLDDTEHAREARVWLAVGEKRNTLGELANTAVSLRLVNSFYRAGATAVWAVQIDRYPDGTENTGKLVIELPPQHEARAEVLQLASRKSAAKGFGDIDDHGQRYVFLMLD